MPSDFNAPGLKRRQNRDGTERLYWAASKAAIAAGFPTRLVRLHYDASDRGQHALIDAACRRFEAEALAWISGRKETVRPFDGTLASLVRCYQTDAASPYRDLKWNTRRTYDQVLRVIEKAFGKRVLSALTITDFRRWYDEAEKPKVQGGWARTRKAHGIVSMLRRLFSYGVTAELAGCARLVSILERMRFKQPARRRQKLELHQVQAFIAKALEMGRLSLAIGTAIQFETAMRQKDVIGEWEPTSDDRAGGIMLRGRRWVRGLTWANISTALVVIKETTKTSAIVSHDLTLSPLVMDLLDHVPTSQRVGPVIVDETAGRPYAEHAYAREWRLIARAAGIPDEVWNMDARAGAISEADDAGAELDLIRSAAGHMQASTTARYARGTVGKSREVSKIRVAHRNKS